MRRGRRRLLRGLVVLWRLLLLLGWQAPLRPGNHERVIGLGVGTQTWEEAGAEVMEDIEVVQVHGYMENGREP